jgi:N12 class adenine-specific DNA methylase
MSRSKIVARNAADGAAIREGSYFIDQNSAPDADGRRRARAIHVRKGRTGDGIPEKHVRIIRKLIPIRDAVREVLKAQEVRPALEDRRRSGCASPGRALCANSARSITPRSPSAEDNETGEVRETHRRPNLQPFLDDPDCWLVASIEDYDLETDTARPGPIFSERVIAPPPAPIITSAGRCARGRAERTRPCRSRPYRRAAAPRCDRGDRRVGAGDLSGSVVRWAWQTADAYLSGAVRTKLVAAEAAAALDPAFERNVTALKASSRPTFGLPTSPHVSARPGFPLRYRRLRQGGDGCRYHHPSHARELASWTVNARQLG